MSYRLKIGYAVNCVDSIGIMFTILWA